MPAAVPRSVPVPGPCAMHGLLCCNRCCRTAPPSGGLPTHVHDDRLLGGLDLAATLRAGRPMSESGTAREADGGWSSSPMAERVTSLVAARLAAASRIGRGRRRARWRDHAGACALRARRTRRRRGRRRAAVSRAARTAWPTCSNSIRSRCATRSKQRPTRDAVSRRARPAAESHHRRACVEALCCDGAALGCRPRCGQRCLP